MFPSRPDRDLPALKSISVSGTTTEPDGPAHKAALADFKAWLRARHPRVAITVRCYWRPENYGHGKVRLETLAPLAARPARGSAQEEPRRLLWIEQAEIEDAWRAKVGWIE